MADEIDFENAGKAHRTRLYDDLRDAKTLHRGKLNFGAYRQSRDHQYLGVNGRNNYGRPWGNDSSNVQSILSGPAYWSRVFYREDTVEVEGTGGPPPPATTPRGAVAPPAPPPKDQTSPSLLPQVGYALIRERMRDVVEGDLSSKPRISPRKKGDRLNFFNTLGEKYGMDFDRSSLDGSKFGKGGAPWDVDKLGHRSSANEVNHIASISVRHDAESILRQR